MEASTRHSLGSTTARSRFLSLTQAVLMLLVVAYHTQVPRVPVTSFVIELFFVLAGFNMARSVDRYRSVVEFALSRARRLFPEVAVIWLIALVIFSLKVHTTGLFLFLITAPVFGQNLIGPYFGASNAPGVSQVFVQVLWFVAALFQMQVILFATRRVFTAFRPFIVVCGIIAFGALFNLVTAMLLGGAQQDLAAPSAGALYQLPFTHIASAALGFMLGRGLLPNIGRLFPVFASAAAIAGVLNIVTSGGAILRGSLGFTVLMEFNYQYIWGYPLAALMLVSFCDPDGFFVTSVERLHVSPALDRLIDTMARLSYGAFVFHGLFLMIGQWIAWSLGWTYFAPMAFVPVTVASFLSAWAFEQEKRRLTTAFARRHRPETDRPADRAAWTLDSRVPGHQPLR